MGDPSHDWDWTVDLCAWLGKFKTPVVITKHWLAMSDDHAMALRAAGAIVNTSTSALDTEAERDCRVGQFDRLRHLGVRSVLRIVSCKFGDTETGRGLRDIQDRLFWHSPAIDNPLRIPNSDPRVLAGDIMTQRRRDLGGGSTISMCDNRTHIGICANCPDRCGMARFEFDKQSEASIHMAHKQELLFESKVEFHYVKSVIGSGHEADVAKLALEDGIAKRAARKNMQIHSAIILEIDGAFAGFFTFQNNEECREFCLLQSVICPEHYTPDLYRQMAVAVIEQNTSGYPALITTDPKSKFETPALFESLGFETYLAMSGFCYMVRGDRADVRMKILAHITMTNVWNSIKGDWLKLKKEWRARIEAAGEKHSVANPAFATREGCWQGESGFANVVTGHSHNGNASVLDPVACEVILRFFMPKDGRRVYNPFGGGVQFGYIAGANGCEYVASEIRQNQCDANNKLCSEFASVRWIQSDSSTYEPDGMFDLVFTCPPYFKVEKYVDYDGNPPAGEINSFSTYKQFRDTLFAGYRKAIDHLKDNRFFVVMTGDSRDKDGAYHCSESETEIFMRDAGLSVYNKIVYLECEFTRLAQAKKTLNYRKFPKREQKIIVAYKGAISAIKDEFAKIGRL